MAARFPERLQDLFQDEVVERFSSMTDFKRFARSKDGLCLDEHVIQSIVEDHEYSAKDKKLKMLDHWKVLNGKMATVWRIRFLVERFYRVETGDQSDILKLDEVFKIFKKPKLSPRGHVYLGEEEFDLKPSRSCAIKFVDFNEETKREGKIFSKLPEHENIISIKRVGVHKSFPFDYIYIVMELGWTRNLRDVFTENKENNIPFDEANAKNLTKQLFRGLSFIHEHKIIHRDMKPENVLVSDDNTVLKITDFGISKPITTGNETTQTTNGPGTEGYRAQETYADGKISPASDVYSTGIIFGEIFSNGHHPFGDDPDLRKYNIRNDLNLDLDHVKSSNRAEIVQLIRKTLCYEPLDRPTAKHVLENDALKKFNPLTLHQPKNMSKSPTVSEILQSTKSQVYTVDRETMDHNLRVQTALSRMMRTIAQSPELMKISMQSLVSTEESEDIMRTASFSTSTDKEIIIHNPSHRRFDIYRLTDGSLMKFGETKEFQSDFQVNINMLVAKEYLYVFGPLEALRIKYLDPDAEWSKVSAALLSLNTLAVKLNESIYICGSSMMLLTLPTVQKYDDGQDRWIPINPMKTARHLPCVIATEDHIYCFGGKDEKRNSLRSIDRFDPTTEEWEVLDVVLPRCMKPGASVTSIDHRIYIQENKNIVCWDTWSDLWTELGISNLEFLRSTFKSITALDKTVFLVWLNEKDLPSYASLPPGMWKNAKQIGREEVAPSLD